MSMPDSFHYCRTKKVRDHAHEDESEMGFVKKKKMKKERKNEEQSDIIKWDRDRYVGRQ